MKRGYYLAGPPLPPSLPAPYHSDLGWGKSDLESFTLSLPVRVVG